MTTIPERRISLKITLGDGDFGQGGASNTLTIPDPARPSSSLWIAATIEKGVSPAMDVAEVRIWGMRQKDMNTLSYLGKPIGFTKKNTMVVQAGDSEKGLTTVFSGVIQSAAQDFRDAPNVSMNLGGQAAAVAAMAPVAPISVKGPADVATLMGQIAASMGLTLENNGVNVTVANPYLKGTATDQMESLARAANIYASADTSAGVLAIWPKGQARKVDQIPLLSKSSGLVGWPTYADVGIGLRSLFFPSGPRVGGLVKVQSEAVPGANKTWYVATLTYDLDTSPGGPWFMDLTGYLLQPSGVPQ